MLSTGDLNQHNLSQDFKAIITTSMRKKFLEFCLMTEKYTFISSLCLPGNVKQKVGLCMTKKTTNICLDHGNLQVKNIVVVCRRSVLSKFKTKKPKTSKLNTTHNTF